MFLKDLYKLFSQRIGRQKERKSGIKELLEDDR